MAQQEELQQPMNEDANVDTTPVIDVAGRGLCGMVNLGNTCFINSTIQCLAHTYELSRITSDKTITKKLNNKMESLIVVEWEKLRSLMWNKNVIISPGGFLSTVQKVAHIKDRDIFTGFTQNDLPEFLMFIIDCMHEGLQKRVKITIAGESKTTEDEYAVICYNTMKNMYEKEYSEILTTFYGLHVSDICVDGVSKSKTPEPFLMINLPLPAMRFVSQNNRRRRATTTLYECFDKYCEPEILSGDNAWYDEDTKTHKKAERRIMFFSLPDVLIISLKRFNDSLKKDSRTVTFPLENMDLSKYVIGYNPSSYVYDLYGVCDHMGSTIGGHYTASIKNPNGRWYQMDDRTVTEIPSSKVVTAGAYCLFYRKRK